MDFNLRARDGIADYRAFAEEAAELVLRFGGSLSGEHRRRPVRGGAARTFGDDLVQAFREFRGLADPDGKMNPGKVVDPYRLDENLRLGPTYNPSRSPPVSRFPADEGDFAKAALRCVGVGKGCKTDCPVNVDMASRSSSLRTEAGGAHRRNFTVLFALRMTRTKLPTDWRRRSSPGLILETSRDDAHTDDDMDPVDHRAGGDHGAGPGSRRLFRFGRRERDRRSSTDRGGSGRTAGHGVVHECT
ncbi:MAG: hypothetical protein H0V33_00035 [Acidimicrobiia bacterium]|nr:hypothetical protein [Acidimicrobiia bacterium]